MRGRQIGADWDRPGRLSIPTVCAGSKVGERVGGMTFCVLVKALSRSKAFA